jgi:hypothetical protein
MIETISSRRDLLFDSSNLAIITPGMCQYRRSLAQKMVRGSFNWKICDAKGEATETQTSLDSSYEYACYSADTKQKLWNNYDHVIGKLVNMIYKPNP